MVLCRAKHRDLDFERRALELKQNEAACTELGKEQQTLAMDLDKREKESVEQAERLRVWEEELSNKESDFVQWENSLAQQQEKMRGIEEREQRLREAVAEHKRVEDEFINVRVAQITARHKHEMQKLESVAATQLKVVANFQAELSKSRQEFVETTERREELERLLRERDLLIENLREEVTMLKLNNENNSQNGNEDGSDAEFDLNHAPDDRSDDDDEDESGPRGSAKRLPVNGLRQRNNGNRSSDSASETDDDHYRASQGKHGSVNSNRNGKRSDSRYNDSKPGKISSFGKGSGKEFIAQLVETQKVLRHILETHNALPFKDSHHLSGPNNFNYVPKVGRVRGVSTESIGTLGSGDGLTSNPNRFLQTKPHVLGSNRGFAGLTAINSYPELSGLPPSMNGMNMSLPPNASIGVYNGSSSHVPLTGGSGASSLFHSMDQTGSIPVAMSTPYTSPSHQQNLQSTSGLAAAANNLANDAKLALSSSSSDSIVPAANGSGSLSASPIKSSRESGSAAATATTNFGSNVILKKSVNISLSADHGTTSVGNTGDSNVSVPLTPTNYSTTQGSWPGRYTSSAGSLGSAGSYQRPVGGSFSGSPTVSFAEAQPLSPNVRRNQGSVTGSSYGNASARATDGKRTVGSVTSATASGGSYNTVESSGIRGLPIAAVVTSSKVAFGVGVSEKPQRGISSAGKGLPPGSPQARVSVVEHSERKGIPVAKVSLK
jgi:hypothetical protein